MRVVGKIGGVSTGKIVVYGGLEERSLLSLLCVVFMGLASVGFSAPLTVYVMCPILLGCEERNNTTR